MEKYRYELLKRTDIRFNKEPIYFVIAKKITKKIIRTREEIIARECDKNLERLARKLRTSCHLRLDSERGDSVQSDIKMSVSSGNLIEPVNSNEIAQFYNSFYDLSQYDETSLPEKIKLRVIKWD